MRKKPWRYTSIYTAIMLGTAFPAFAIENPNPENALYAAAPTISSFSVTPSNPIVKEPITFTIKTSSTANKVEFQFSGGSRQLMTGSNSGKDWTYLRTEGLADTNVKSFSVFVNGSSSAGYTGTVQAKTAIPVVQAVMANPSLPNVGQPITFTAKTDISASKLEFQFAGGNRQLMTSSNGGKDWTYYRSEGLVDTNTKSFSVFVNGSSSAGYNGSIQAKATVPVVQAVTANPSLPNVGQPITFTARTDISASKLEFQFAGGSRQLMTSSNGGKDWTYIRSEGLADTNVKSFSVFVNGSSDAGYNGSIQAKATTPVVQAVTADPAVPTIGQPITFTAKTDISASKLEFQFSGCSRQLMTSSNGGKDWTYYRPEGLADTNTKSFSVFVNGSANAGYSGSIQAKEVAGPTVLTVSANPSAPIVGQPITFTARTDIRADKVEFQFAGGSRQLMTSSNGGKDWTYYRPEGLADTNTKSFSVFVNGSANAGYTGSIQAKATLPIVQKVTADPAIPTVGQAITFTAKTDSRADKVEFQFTGGSRQLMTSSNGGLDWTYYRPEGLADTNVKSFSVFVNGSASAGYNGTIQAKDAASPSVTGVSANPEVPEVGKPVTFTAKTDLRADKVEFQFVGGSRQPMISSNDGKSWTYNRTEGLADTAVKQFVVYVNGNATPSYNGTIQAKSASTPVVLSVSANPATPTVGQPVTFTAKTDVRADKVEFQFTGGSRQLMTSSNGGLDWIYYRPEGLADTNVKSFSVFVNGSNTPSRTGEIQAKSVAHSWDVVSSSHAAGAVVNTDQSLQAWWVLKNSGAQSWDNYQLDECTDAQLSQCSPVKSNISLSASSTVRIERQFATPNTEGAFVRYYRLKTPAGELIKNSAGQTTFKLELKVQNLAAKLCQDTGVDCSTAQERYEKARQQCLNSTTQTKLSQITQTANGFSFSAELVNGQWFMHTAFSAPFNIQSNNTDIQNLAREFNDVKHIVFPINIGARSTNDKYQYCDFEAAQTLVMLSFTPERTRISEEKSKFIRGLDATVVSASDVNSTAVSSADFQRNLGLGLGDALMDEASFIQQVQNSRANWVYAINYSSSDLFVKDVKDLIEIKDLPAKIAILKQQINTFKSIAGNLNEASFVRLMDNVNEFAQSGSLGNAEAFKQYLQQEFKPALARFLGIENTPLTETPEFAYLLGYYGGQFMVDFVQTRISYDSMDEILKKSGQNVAKKTLKGLFKYGKIADRLASGIEQEAMEKLNTDSGISMLLSIRDVAWSMKNIGANQASTTSLSAAGVPLPVRCAVLDAYPSAQSLSGCAKLTSANPYGFKHTGLYAVIHNDIAKNSGKQQAYSGTNYANCEVHHIIPHSVTVKSTLGGYRYFENDVANFVVLPSKKADGSPAVCYNGGKAVLHSAHPVYNAFIKTYFEVTGQDGGFATPEKYVFTQSMLRGFLSNGRGMFPIRKSDPLSDKAAVEHSKKRHSKAAVAFFEQYMKHFN